MFYKNVCVRVREREREGQRRTMSDYDIIGLPKHMNYGPIA